MDKYQYYLGKKSEDIEVGQKKANDLVVDGLVVLLSHQ